MKFAYFCNFLINSYTPILFFVNLQLKWQVRNDISTWQSMGLDVLYNAANGLLEKVLRYKPFAQEVDKAVESMGLLLP